MASGNNRFVAGSHTPSGPEEASGSVVRYGPAQIEQILALRARELRAGKPVDSARFPEDDDSTTLHFAAWVNETVVGCLTLIEQSGDEGPVWQLRGMATVRPWRKRGLGRNLLAYAEHHLKIKGRARVKEDRVRIWCNARTEAVSFYKRMGYRVLSDEFMIERIGPHYKMEKILM
ncbi:MAG: GNAT family N-acetyltransferase [Cyclonatronaceae bacterium]